jgi:hypothetical protein
MPVFLYALVVGIVGVVPVIGVTLDSGAEDP